MDFDDLTNPGDYIDCDYGIGKRNYIKNDEFCIKTKEEIRRGIVLLIFYSHKKADIENL